MPDHAARADTHFFGDGCSPAHVCPFDHTKNPLKADICGTCGAALDRWWEKPSQTCTGGYTCWAEVHEHGCYSDHGDCTAPEEHVHA